MRTAKKICLNFLNEMYMINKIVGLNTKKARGLLVIICFCFAIQGCAGTETVYRYHVQDNTSSWKVQRELENHFQTGTSEGALVAGVYGIWPTWEMGGPLFMPIITLPMSSEYVSLNIYLTESSHLLDINSAILKLNNDEQIKFTKVDFFRYSKFGEGITIQFPMPDFVPTELSFTLDGTKVGAEKIYVPPLRLNLDSERCFWYGDSIPNYVGCQIIEGESYPY